MLVTATLLVKSLNRLESVDPGFRADNLLLAALDPKAAGSHPIRIAHFWRNALERVAGIRRAQRLARGNGAAGDRPPEATLGESGVRREDRARHQFGWP